jgi:hypothetical protein
MKLSSAACVIVALLCLHPCTALPRTPENVEAPWSELASQTDFTFVSSAQELLWAVGNQTKIIIVQHDLDMRDLTAPSEPRRTAVLEFGGTIAIWVRLPAVHSPERHRNAAVAATAPRWCADMPPRHEQQFPSTRL